MSSLVQNSVLYIKFHDQSFQESVIYFDHCERFRLSLSHFQIQFVQDFFNRIFQEQEVVPEISNSDQELILFDEQISIVIFYFD